MTIYAILFYLLATVILASTVLAVTRRNLVHAAIFLVVSFFASALLFYLLGAPLLAMLEIIVYVGAIMVLFLFVIMMLREKTSTRQPARGRQLWTAALGLIYLAAVILLVSATGPRGQVPLIPAVAHPTDFGRYLFQGHWLGIEIASLLLLIALIGVLHLGGRTISRRHATQIGEKK